MENNKFTEIVIIIDKSGSMYDLQDDVIGGYNSFIEEQKKLGPAKVTIVTFNHEVNIVAEEEDINTVQRLNKKNYSPSGCTALLDAVGDSIALIKAKHAKLKAEELPEHTIFSIVTDGLENSSREYTYPRIKQMIDLQTKCGWNFIFQAANIDVAQEASRLGIHRDMCFSFAADPEGIRNQTRFLAKKVSCIRDGGGKKAKK